MSSNLWSTQAEIFLDWWWSLFLCWMVDLFQCNFKTSGSQPLIVCDTLNLKKQWAAFLYLFFSNKSWIRAFFKFKKMKRKRLKIWSNSYPGLATGNWSNLWPFSIAISQRVTLGSSSSTFYDQLLCAQIPKAQKRLITWLSFLRFRDLRE